jgi:hypothetical protein
MLAAEAERPRFSDLRPRIWVQLRSPNALALTSRALTAGSPSALRPSPWPISPSVARSPSETLRRPFNRPLGIRFSAAKYSLRKSNRWSDGC